MPENIIPENIIEPVINKNIPDEKNFPIAGVGASAGGLLAFEAFFSGMPADIDTGIAFILVQHLSPEHKSILPDIIGRYTRMKVFEVTDGIKVMPNCIYIIPPKYDMAFLNGKLHLLNPTDIRGHRLPIDFFFRSLAKDQKERAIAIVLSGTGSDGTLGVRAVKGEGGMVMVQNPESTEYDGMPRNAINTGMVDYVLPPAEMADQLISYVNYSFGKQTKPPVLSVPKAEDYLNKIFILLRAQTGHDFSQYKTNTIYRRIERRMAIHQIKEIGDYVLYLQKIPTEVTALFRDLLIGVTNFFRDPEAFVELERQIIPKLFAAKAVDGIIRVWSPGCSTGEEAYSIAILIAEYQESIKQNYKVQIFATDIDSHAIAIARAGIYPASIATDISADRLQRFFRSESDGTLWSIHKKIREMLIFSEQNMINDPPFSRLDLISCRNLMIYLDGRLQKKIIPMFHYSLNPGGFLFLGTSETTGEFNHLFTTLDRKLKIYQRKDVDIGIPRTSFMPFVFPLISAQAPGAPQLTAGKKGSPIKRPMRELTEEILLQQVVPTAILVNSQGEILYIHGRTGKFLELMPGETTTYNILNMAREGLKYELTIHLHKAVATKEIVCCSDIQVKTNGDFTTVNLTIRPVETDRAHNTKAGSPLHPDLTLYLITMEEMQSGIKRSSQPSGKEDRPLDSDARILSLEQALQIKDEYLQATNEELETSNEELKSSNEEMQSMNEELQSTNEELETSKEELQSLNEELSTVNAELQAKVADLSRANNDMNNLLAGTGIATIFVDHKLCVMRFTPTITNIINLILTDVGRPVAHLVANLVNYETLVADIQTVLNNLIPKEVRVQTKSGAWYQLKIQPYRTLENVIEGAVLTFVNIIEP
ncbi:MAG: PAS domain-containing protein [Desulfamplus sp.]|nr:PAS domain-containing protein [Desulfamplus sp.]